MATISDNIVALQGAISVMQPILTEFSGQLSAQAASGTGTVATPVSGTPVVDQSALVASLQAQVAAMQAAYSAFKAAESSDIATLDAVMVPVAAAPSTPAAPVSGAPVTPAAPASGTPVSTVAPTSGSSTPASGSSTTAPASGTPSTPAT